MFSRSTRYLADMSAAEGEAMFRHACALKLEGIRAAVLLDHLIGSGEERGRGREAEHFRGLEVDDELEAFSLLHR